MQLWQLRALWRGESIQTNHEWETVDNLGQRTVCSIQHAGNKIVGCNANGVHVLQGPSTSENWKSYLLCLCKHATDIPHPRIHSNRLHFMLPGKQNLRLPGRFCYFMTLLPAFH